MKDILHPFLSIDFVKQKSLFIEEFKSSDFFPDYEKSYQQFDYFIQPIHNFILTLQNDRFELNFRFEMNGNIYVKFFFKSHLSRRHFYGYFDIIEPQFVFEKHEKININKIHVYNKEIEYIKNTLKPLEDYLKSIQDEIIINTKLHLKQLNILNKFKPNLIKEQRELIKKFFNFPKKDIVNLLVKDYFEGQPISLHSLSFKKDKVDIEKILFLDKTKKYTTEDLIKTIKNSMKYNNIIPNFCNIHPFNSLYDLANINYVSIPISELSNLVSTIQNIENF